ncbi:MAG: hypothetical protein H6942_03165 [Candidatus Accumulibacter sp.]|uniref:hypothetical protein n=1 Tax=Accumulibacter sp. TaxID=2053492 RepID=UPI001A08C5B3|nr:hypothetical protein [Accumulibacter sp.]MBE2260851.1 hypothetical protein [Paracoccaceae bacterium]MCP5247536.1 hypothetical protein [Accumulibacter sp.]
MTNTASDDHGVNEAELPQSGIRTILQWIESPMAPHAAEELPSLRAQVKALRDVGGTPKQRASALDGLYTRTSSVLATLLPELADLLLPVPRKTRRLVRSVLDLLQMLADDTLAVLEGGDGLNTTDPHQAADLALWRSLHALARQLMISHLIAAPAPAGAWQQLHQTYATARRLRLETAIPRGQTSSLQHIYHAAVLLGCAQPASLTAREVLFLAAYFERFAGQMEMISASAAVAPGTFWIDPTRDIAALSSARKVAPSASPFECFSCARLGVLLKTQVAQLKAGTSPQAISLPDFAGTAAGLGALHRLAWRWSETGKRRFHRRRQNYRTVLSSGIDDLWQLCKTGNVASLELSNWMITNESPDGYAVMHVSGKIGSLSVGDVAAVRTGDDQNWQICVVRWALSENPEHLELGLQILAPRAVPAILARPSDNQGTQHLRVLILPEIPMLRSSQLLVVASGALTGQDKKLLLVIEEQNLTVREVKSISIDEQTGSVEILSIEPDQNVF